MPPWACSPSPPSKAAPPPPAFAADNPHTLLGDPARTGESLPFPKHLTQEERRHLKTFDELDFEVYSGQQWDRLGESHAENIRVHWPDGHYTDGLERHVEDLKFQLSWSPDSRATDHGDHGHRRHLEQARHHGRGVHLLRQPCPPTADRPRLTGAGAEAVRRFGTRTPVLPPGSRRRASRCVTADSRTQRDSMSTVWTVGAEGRWYAFLTPHGTFGGQVTTPERDLSEERRLRPPEDDDALGGSSALGAVVTTAVITAAVVPFVQTLVTKAAEDSYAVARDWLRRQFGREDAGEGDPESPSRTLLVVRDPDPALNVALCLGPDVSHEAIRALEHFDIEAVTTEAELDAVTKVRVYWDEAAGSWRTERKRRRGRGN